MQGHSSNFSGFLGPDFSCAHPSSAPGPVPPAPAENLQGGGQAHSHVFLGLALFWF